MIGSISHLSLFIGILVCPISSSIIDFYLKSFFKLTISQFESWFIFSLGPSRESIEIMVFCGYQLYIIEEGESASPVPEILYSYMTYFLIESIPISSDWSLAFSRALLLSLYYSSLSISLPQRSPTFLHLIFLRNHLQEWHRTPCS
jgi:hypothetical protein